MLGILSLLILSPLIAWLIYWYVKLRHYEKYLKNVPGPRPVPLFGNAMDFSSSEVILPSLMKHYNKYKGNFKIYLGSQAQLVITEPKDMEFLMNHKNTITKSDFYNFLHHWLGTGLLTSTGNKWRKHRKIITPAFHFQILEDFVDIFNTQGDVLVSKLKEVTNKSSLDVYPFVGRAALDIICEAAMGTSVNAQNDYNSKYVTSVKLLLETFTIRMFSPIYANPFVFMFTEEYRKEKQALKVVVDFARSVITQRKKELYNNSKSKEEVVDSLGRRKKQFFLDLLLDYSSRDSSFTEENIREEVDTFMFEGYDTTATSITFALHSLARHPDVQKKVYEEMKTVLAGDLNRKPAYRDLQEMKYLEMVIKESLRLNSTVPFIGREVEQDIDWNGTTLPKGLMVLLFLSGTHHSAHIHEDPDTFNPERYAPENLKTKHAFSSLPFSAGPRNCIGQKFAMLEIKSVVMNVLRNFELLAPVPDHKIILRSEGVLKSGNGVYIGLKQRQ